MIYLDNAATTPVHLDVVRAMQPFLEDHYGNASSIHGLGREAKAALDRARIVIANFIQVKTSDFIFTGTGTESIHTALFGAFLASPQNRHLITTAVEHHAVLHTCEFLKHLGAEVTLVPPRADGQIHAEDMAAAVRPDTFLVSAMMVNNETGAILPVQEIARQVKAVNSSIVVHSDCVQALGAYRMNLGEMDVDLASFSAHKVYGPKGVGALFVRQGARWSPVLHGGAQERERRAGTENVAGIAGFGAAVDRLASSWTEHISHLETVRDEFLKQLRDLDGVHSNTPEYAVPNILNLWVEGVRNDTLLMRLDMEGVAASAGSACTAGSLEPSHVLEACGYPRERVLQSVRFSFSEWNTLDEVAQAADILKRIVRQLRK